jgi:hypothetical protein
MDIIGNPDRWPGAHGGTLDECRAWEEKDATLRAEGNQDPFPRYGDVAAQTAWHSKDMELRRAAKTGKSPSPPPKVNGATAAKSDAELANDSCELPMDVVFLKKTLGAINPADRETFLAKLLVSSRDGGLPASVIIVAQQEYYDGQVDFYMRENAELYEQLRSERQARNHSEKEIIDALADRLFDFTKEFVVSEAKRRVESLQAKVLAKSSQIKNEGDAIAQLHAGGVLRDGRIRFLELTSPVWVSVNSGG